MFESILQRYSFNGVDTSGEKVGGFDLPASAGVTYVIVGHTEPLELVHEGGAGDALPIPAGLTVISGPYRDASGGAPRLIRATGASTDVDVIVVREEGSNFRHEPLGDVVRIDDADPVDVEAPGKSLVGTQQPSGTSAVPINPATNGASTPCDILIQNVGDYALWISTGSTQEGLKLKPGQSVKYDGHVADDGDLTLYPDNTTQGFDAQASFLD